MKGDLAKRLQLRPQSLPLVVHLFLLSFCIGLVKIFLFTAGNALFVTQVGSEQLAFVYLGVALVSPIVGLLALVLQRSLHFEAALLSNLALLAVVTAALRFMLDDSQADGIRYALLVWYYIVNAMVGVTFWSLAARVIDIHESKHVYGLTGSGTFIAGFCGGLAVRPFLIVARLEDVLWLAVAALCVCGVIVVRVCRRFETNQPVQVEALTHTGSANGHTRRFVLADLVIVGLVACSFCFVDRVFLSQAEVSFGNSEQLAIFLGEFSATVELVSFAVQIAATGWVLNRFGIDGVLSVMPLALLLFAVLALGVLPLTASPKWLLVLFCGMKFCDLVFRKSINMSALQLLIRPLPAEQRERLRMWGQMIVMPAARGAASMAMLGFLTLGWGGSVPLTIAIALLAAAWLVVSRVAGREYQVLHDRSKTVAVAEPSVPEQLPTGEAPLFEVPEDPAETEPPGR